MEISEEIRKSIHQFNYITRILSRDFDSQLDDHDKLYKLTIGTSSRKFKSYGVDKQVRVISKLEGNIDGFTVKKGSVKELLLNNSKPAWETGMDGVSFSVSLMSTIFSGSACLASLLTVPYGGVGVPSTITTCPVFLVNAALTTYSGYQLLGNSNRANKSLQQGNSILLDSIKQNKYNKFLNSDDYNFIVGDDINLSAESSSFHLPIKAITETEENFLEFLKSQLSNGGLLINEQKLQLFLEGYLEKIGQVQNELIIEYIENSNKAKLQEQKALNEKVAFYRGLGELTSVFFGSKFSPREAKILSTFANVGFEYIATGAALGAYGWGAVGIQIATSFLNSRNKSGEFERYLLKSLEHINLQLETINKKLDEFYYNQIDILVELYQISSKIDNLTTNVLNGLEQISTRLSTISDSISQQDKNIYNTAIQASNLVLKDKLIDNSSSIKDTDVYKQIQALRNNFLIHLNKPYFTSCIKGKLDGNLLKKEIYDFKGSLYDKSGLLPALFEFSPSRLSVATNNVIYHPVESYIACQNITSWLTLSDLSKTDSLNLIKDIQSALSKSIAALNQYGEFEIVSTKALEYREFHHKLNKEVYNNLSDLETKGFASSPLTWLKAVKLTPEGYSFTEDPWNRDNSDYNNDMTDVSYFDVLLEFGFIKRIVTITDSPLNLAARSRPVIGSVIGSRVLEIEFNDFIINHISNKKINNLRIRCNKKATCTEQHVPRNILTPPHPLSPIFTPTKYSISTDFQDKWKSAIENQCKYKENYDINDEIKGFDSMTFLDFTKHLINEYVNKRKKEFLDNIFNRFFNENATLNGIGTSLMVLSLLNKTITSELIHPFVVDYLDETYIDQDFGSLFQKYYYLESTEKQLERKDELAEISKTYELNVNGETIDLNVSDWKAYICLLLKHRVELTIRRSLNGCQKLKPNDAEPYLADSMNKLNWFEQNYLELKA